MIDVCIRAARPEDKQRLVPWTTNTFQWGDYIADIFERWTDDPMGRFLVAECGGRLCGCLHVALLGENEAWHEGMRVHPDFRRMGVSSALEFAGREYSLENGCLVTRLATDAENFPAQSTVSAQGYTRLFKLSFWKIEPLAGIGRDALVGEPSRLSRLLELWETSESRRLYDNVAAVGNWHWAKLSRRRLELIINRGEIRWFEHGMWRSEIDESDHGYYADNICVDDGLEIPKLIAMIREDATRRGALKIEIGTHEESNISKHARDANLAYSGGTCIYEFKLARNENTA